MVEDGGKDSEPKLEFHSTGQAIAYISLDQARVLALRHARDNRDFYGRQYSRQELTWEELSAEESEDYYRVRLSYRRPWVSGVSKTNLTNNSADDSQPRWKP